MHIALLIRGPVRPSCRAALDNINFFLRSLEGHTVRTYLWAWDTAAARELAATGGLDRAWLVEEPTEAEIEAAVGRGFPIPNHISCFKQFHAMRQAVEWVGGGHDFVVQFRCDSRIAIADLSAWLNPGCYTTAHTRLESEFTNDQIGAAEPEVMRRAWSFSDETELSGMMRAAKRPEDVLDAIVRKNGVRLKQADLAVWALDPNRHCPAT